MEHISSSPVIASGSDTKAAAAVGKELDSHLESPFDEDLPLITPIVPLSLVDVNKEHTPPGPVVESGSPEPKTTEEPTPSYSLMDLAYGHPAPLLTTSPPVPELTTPSHAPGIPTEVIQMPTGSPKTTPISGDGKASAGPSLKPEAAAAKAGPAPKTNTTPKSRTTPKSKAAAASSKDTETGKGAIVSIQSHFLQRIKPNSHRGKSPPPSSSKHRKAHRPI